MVITAARSRLADGRTDVVASVAHLAELFAARAPAHDREASFPFENFADLSRAGLLALTVPAAFGGAGAGARYTARVLGIIGKADPSTALTPNTAPLLRPAFLRNSSAMAVNSSIPVRMRAYAVRLRFLNSANSLSGTLSY